MRVVLVLGAALLLGAGLAIGYVALIALRRSEGVFMPAGYVSVACLAGGAYLLRVALRG